MGGNGIAKYVKLAVGVIVTLAFIVYGFDIIRMLVAKGEIGHAVTVIVLYLTTMGYVIKDVWTSGREKTEIEAAAGCKQKIVAEITCD